MSEITNTATSQSQEFFSSIDGLMIGKDRVHEFINGKFQPLEGYGEKVWVKNTLAIWGYYIPFGALSSVIARCTVKELKIKVKISVKDFEMLTQAETVENLFINEGIIDTGGNFLSIEDIFQCVPNADKFQIFNSNFTSNTMERLISTNRKQKIQRLDLTKVKVELNVDEFYEFFKKNAAPRAFVYISFEDQERERAFQLALKTKVIESYEPKEDAFNIYLNPCLHKTLIIENGKIVGRREWPIGYNYPPNETEEAATYSHN